MTTTKTAILFTLEGEGTEDQLHQAFWRSLLEAVRQQTETARDTDDNPIFITRVDAIANSLDELNV